jgi:hypothetical protein
LNIATLHDEELAKLELDLQTVKQEHENALALLKNMYTTLEQHDKRLSEHSTHLSILNEKVALEVQKGSEPDSSSALQGE